MHFFKVHATLSRTSPKIEIKSELKTKRQKVEIVD